MALKIDGCLSRDRTVIEDMLADSFHGISSYQHYPDSFRVAQPSPNEAIRRFVVLPDRGHDFNLPFNYNEPEFALKRSLIRSQVVGQNTHLKFRKA